MELRRAPATDGNQRRINRGAGITDWRMGMCALSLCIAVVWAALIDGWRVVNRECDSPYALTNHTLDHLEKHWAKELDFVICECSKCCVRSTVGNSTVIKKIYMLQSGTGDTAR